MMKAIIFLAMIISLERIIPAILERYYWLALNFKPGADKIFWNAYGLYKIPRTILSALSALFIFLEAVYGRSVVISILIVGASAAWFTVVIFDVHRAARRASSVHEI